jgi:hypothetical protein
MYVKAAGYNFVALNEQAQTGSSSSIIDLQDGSGATGSTTVTAVGDGWWRIGWSPTASFGSPVFLTVVALPISGVNPNSYTWAGDGTSGIYIFGAQLSDSASVDPYVYQPVAAPASTAYYGPRFDYDPLTLAPKGLLIEEQRVNLLTFSEQFDNATVWGPLRASILANTIIAPDGTLTSDKFVEDTSANTHLLNRILGNPLSSGTYTYSIYAKNDGRRYLQITLIIDPASTNARYAVMFDLQTGTVSSTAENNSPTSTSNSITSVDNSFYRCTVTVGNPSGLRVDVQHSLSNISVANASGIAYTGDGTSGIFLWGAQLEVGAFATSYIPTVASQVTRAADNASMIGNNFARWYNVNNGSLYMEWVETFNSAAFAGNSGGVSLNANSNTPCFEIIPRTSDISASARGIGGGATSTIGSLPSASRNAGTSYKAAMAFSQNPLGNVADFSLNGTAFPSNTLLTANSMVGINQLEIGKQVTSGTTIGTRCFKRVAYYSRKLAATELQSITS